MLKRSRLVQAGPLGRGLWEPPARQHRVKKDRRGFFPPTIALEVRSISPDAGVPLELDRSACTHQCKHRMMEADAVSVAELGDTRFGDNQGPQEIGRVLLCVARAGAGRLRRGSTGPYLGPG